MDNMSFEFLRKRFDKLNGYYGKKGIAPQLSYLRIEENLENGKGSYQFNLKKENLNRLVENGLKRNDLFATIGIGVFLRVENSVKPGVNQLLSYAPIANKDICKVGFNKDDINALYNGQLYISTGTTVNLQDTPVSLFRKIGQAQSGELCAAATSAGKQDQFDFEQIVKKLPEELVFAGTQDHTIKVEFPTFSGADYTSQADYSGTAATAGVSKIVFVAYGWRVIGSTAEQYRNDEANPYRTCI